MATVARTLREGVKVRVASSPEAPVAFRLMQRVEAGQTTRSLFWIDGKLAYALSGNFDERRLRVLADLVHARIGMIAPDETTYAYLAERRNAPKGADWDRALAYWRTLHSDPDAKFDAVVMIDAAEINRVSIGILAAEFLSEKHVVAGNAHRLAADEPRGQDALADAQDVLEVEVAIRQLGQTVVARDAER